MTTIDRYLIKLHKMYYPFGAACHIFALLKCLSTFVVSAEKTKQGKQFLGKSLLAQMHWQHSKKRTTTVASVVCSADFCAELFPPGD